MADWKKIGKGISSGLGDVSKKAGEAAQKKYEEFEEKRIENNKREEELKLKRKAEKERQQEIDKAKEKILKEARKEEEKKELERAEKFEADLRKIHVYTNDVAWKYSYVDFIQGYGQRNTDTNDGEIGIGSKLANPKSARMAREAAIRELKVKALKMGATAIIGCQVEVVKTSWRHSTSGHTTYTSTMYECFSVGTAVKY